METSHASRTNLFIDAGQPRHQSQSPLLSSIPTAVAVSSGKGGVGKTSVVANLALAAATRGRKVLIVDCDLGLSNVDVQMGLNPKYNLLHALLGERSLEEVIVTGVGGVRVLPAPFGIQELTHLTREQKLGLLALLEQVGTSFDTVLLDTGAGISSNVLFFNLLASQIVVVLTPEPGAMTGAYSLIKVLHTRHGQDKFHLLVNKVQSAVDGLACYRRLVEVVHNFLNVSINYLGSLTRDTMFTKSTLMCRPLLDLYPRSTFASGFSRMAETIESFSIRTDPRPGNLDHRVRADEHGNPPINFEVLEPGMR